jgi:hypothetical protein
MGTACLFPWHGRQKPAARMLWRIVSRKGGESDETVREACKYVMFLSEELICQDVCHKPFESGLIHFLAVLGINPDAALSSLLLAAGRPWCRLRCSSRP